MITVTLKPDVVEQINYLTEIDETATNTDEIVDKALRLYLEQLRQKKIEAEHTSFEQQRETLLLLYLNEYVAVHKGQVIDHDPNLRTLHLRVFAHLGHTPVLLKKVSNKPEQELIFRSPRIQRP